MKRAVNPKKNKAGQHDSKKKRNRRVEWVRLESASKIFPATANHKDTKVFRMFCELNDLVDPVTLQAALDRTLLTFPFYRSVLRRGVFWYYLERSTLEPKVEPESLRLYSPLYIKGERKLSFRVTYHLKRINLEIFHALTDGTGAFRFLETLAYHYLLMKYPDDLKDNIPELSFDASQSQRMDDSFGRHFRYRSGNSEEQKLSAADQSTDVLKHSEQEPVRSKADKRDLRRLAYQIPGARNELGMAGLIEGELSAKAVLELAHSYHTTLTVFITAVYMLSIYEDMPNQKRRRPVSVVVPVNLRQFYQSETARNFFTVMHIRHLRTDTSIVPTLEELIAFVQDSFKDKLNEERLMGRVRTHMKLERFPLIRVVPTSVKDLILRFSHWLSDLNTSASVSNVGRVKMPEAFANYIHHYGVSTSVRRTQICSCTTGDRLIISFSSPIRENEIQRRFFRFFTSKGLSVTISSNLSVLPDKRKLAQTLSTGFVNSSEAALRSSLPLLPKEDQEMIRKKQEGDTHERTKL